MHRSAPTCDRNRPGRTCSAPHTCAAVNAPLIIEGWSRCVDETGARLVLVLVVVGAGMTAVADAEQRVLGVGGLGSGSAPHAGHGVGASGPVTVGAERAQQATTRSATA